MAWFDPLEHVPGTYGENLMAMSSFLGMFHVAAIDDGESPADTFLITPHQLDSWTSPAPAQSCCQTVLSYQPPFSS